MRCDSECLGLAVACDSECLRLTSFMTITTLTKQKKPSTRIPAALRDSFATPKEKARPGITVDVPQSQPPAPHQTSQEKVGAVTDWHKRVTILDTCSIWKWGLSQWLCKIKDANLYGFQSCQRARHLRCLCYYGNLHELLIYLGDPCSFVAHLGFIFILLLLGMGRETSYLMPG